MAGQSAGALEIEIMANVARLQEDMRKMQKAVGDATGSMGRSARAANDNLRGIGKGAGAGMQQFSREVARLKAQMDPAWAATERYKDQVRLLQQALREGAITHKQFVGEMRSAVATYQNAGMQVNKVNGAQRAGMQQLSYQLGDVATMFSMGARPMQIFASQSGQVVQAVQMMSGGTSKFAAFLGGPWGMALTAGAMVLAPLVAKLFEGSDAADEASASIEDLTQQFDFAAMSADQLRQVNELLAESNKDIERTALQAANATRQKAESDLRAAQAALDAAKAELAKVEAMRSNPFLAAQAPTSALGEWATAADDVRARIDTLQETIGGFAGVANRSRFEAEMLTAGMTAQEKQAESLRATINGLKQAYEATGDQRFLDTARRYQEQLASLEDQAGSTASASSRATRARTAAMSEAEKAADRQTKATQNFIESLQDEIAKIGLDEKALRQLEIARQLEAAQTEAQRQAIRDLNAERERELELEARRARVDAQEKQTDAYRANAVEPLRREAQALGLVGWERDKYLLKLEREAELKPLLADLTRALAKGEHELAAAIREQIGLLDEKYALESQMGDWHDADRKAAEQARLYNDELRQTINLLGQIGGVGDVLGGVLGVLTGNTSAIGGPIGQLLNMQFQTTNEDGQKIARTLGDEMMEIFNGLDSPFFKTFSSLLQGAGTGLLVGNAIFGQQDMAESIGSAIGGALGQAAGTAVAGPVGGAIGNILGSLAGGFLGDLIGGTPRGSAIIGNAGGVLDVTGYYGGSDSREQAASGMAGDALDVIDRIAEQLGATVNAAMGSVSIGVRDDHIHVDPQGRGYTKISKYPDIQEFGQDAEAAILFVIKDLINDGVLEGLRAGTERLIQQGGDLEKALEEALAFEGVFKELEQMRDPVGYALDQLENEFARLSGIFDKAGATVEEYADLEELFARKRQEILDDARQRQVDDLSQRNSLEVELLQLLGRESEALAQAREFEIAGLEKTLQPLQRVIYQLQDARQIMDQFGPLADSLREFRNELAGSRSNRDGFAVAQDLFRSTARAASDGDAGAMAKLQNTATDYLDAAKAEASSALDYKRAVAEVMGAVDESIFAADAQVEYAQMQIDAINANSAELVTTREKLAEVMQQTNDNTAAVRRMLERFDGDGMTIRTNEDTPIYVRTADGDTVAVV